MIIKMPTIFLRIEKLLIKTTAAIEMISALKIRYFIIIPQELVINF